MGALVSQNLNATAILIALTNCSSVAQECAKKENVSTDIWIVMITICARWITVTGVAVCMLQSFAKMRIQLVTK